MDLSDTAPRINTLKQRARDLLSGISGVRSIGFGWDGNGNQVLQVDVAPGADRATVEGRLETLHTTIRIREVSGKIKRNEVGNT
jgi:hypothetical protein